MEVLKMKRKIVLVSILAVGGLTSLAVLGSMSTKITSFTDRGNTTHTIGKRMAVNVIENNDVELDPLDYVPYNTGDRVYGYYRVDVTKDDVAVGESVVIHESTYTFKPTEIGTYIVTFTQVRGDESPCSEDNIGVAEVVVEHLIEFYGTSEVALPNMGIMLYANAHDENFAYSITKDDVDVTASTIFTWTSADSSVSRTYFKADAGDYVLTVTADDEDSTTRSMNITVADDKTNIYGRDVNGTNYANRIVMGKDSETLFINAVANEEQSAKLGKNIPMTHDWTIEFDITDMKYVAQGQFDITKATENASDGWMGWEDIALGGKPGNDLWGFEADIIGSGWNTYQWRSNWQNTTTEFMPDPTDHSIGCGRGAGAYSQYGTGTHTYKIQCVTDTDGNVTYNYYIDNQIEAVHHTADAHDWGNGMDFYQLSARNFNGLVHNFSIK